MTRYDTVVKDGTLVVPYSGIVRADLGIKDGRISCIADEIISGQAERVVNAGGKVVFPGAVDSHFHVGIYRPFSQDAESESRSALVGGVTTLISYFRTGHHYLNKTGPYREIFPEVLELSREHFHTDYAFHLAIMTADQLQEVDELVEKHGVGSFKFYMFYKGLNLAASSTRGSEYTMADNYDLGHLYLLMESVSRISRKHRERGRISLSLHCENPELIRVFIEKVKAEGIKGLEAYSKARPPLTEHLSILEAVLLAKTTSCPINLLHLSSKSALQAGIEGRRANPEMNIALETTLHHLALSYDTAGGVIGKVNPPIRQREDCDFLWKGIQSGEVDTVVSDHACCMEQDKHEDDLWGSLPGFGGSSLLYPVLISEGFHKRKLPLTRIAELASANPARNFGLFPRKGTIAIGGDADLAIVDLDCKQAVTNDLLCSAQDFTPFAGMKITGWPVITMLRGEVLYAGGKIVSRRASGEYLRRPADLHRENTQSRMSAAHSGELSHSRFLP